MNILTVLTGGTIGSARRGGVISPDRGSGSRLLQAYRKINGAVSFTVTAPYTVLSENLGAEHLRQLRVCLTKIPLENYDGVIVCHGTDTLAYTAAYLSFVLAASAVPIVLVSANYPLTDPRSNGFDNFAAAVDFISSGESGVYVAYRNTGERCASIHRGDRLLPHQACSDSVHSLFGEVYGTVRDGRFVKNPAFSAGEVADLSDCELNGSVLFVRPYVGQTYPALSGEIKAVLLEGWHSGTLPTAQRAFIAFCRHAAARHIPLYLTGSTEGFSYESKLVFQTLGIQVLPPMSPVAAYVKLWLES